jgi:hypothetical protein
VIPDSEKLAIVFSKVFALFQNVTECHILQEFSGFWPFVGQTRSESSTLREERGHLKVGGVMAYAQVNKY